MPLPFCRTGVVHAGSCSIHRHGDGHIDHVEFVDGFHAQIGKARHLGGFDGIDAVARRCVRQISHARQRPLIRWSLANRVLHAMDGGVQVTSYINRSISLADRGGLLVRPAAKSAILS